MILEEQNPGGLGVLPLVYLAALAAPFVVGGAFTWLSVKEREKQQTQATDRELAQLAQTGSGSIALKPPPAPAAPRTEAEMRGGWTPERQAEENKKLYAQYVAEAPSLVEWSPILLPKGGIKANDTVLYAALALGTVGALMLAKG